MATTETRPPSQAEAGKAALAQLEAAYKRRRSASPEEVCQLYASAAELCLRLGMSALERRWLPDLETATDAFIKWRARARRDKQTTAFKQGAEEAKSGLPKEEFEASKEFMVGVRLMSIRDPFKAWKAVGKEISKHWPEGVSAVDAVREQRRW